MLLALWSRWSHSTTPKQSVNTESNEQIKLLSLQPARRSGPLKRAGWTRAQGTARTPVWRPAAQSPPSPAHAPWAAASGPARGDITSLWVRCLSAGMHAWIAAKHSIRAAHEQRLGQCRQRAAHAPAAVCCAPDLGAPGRQIQAREGWSPAAAHLHGHGQRSKVLARWH